jgi:hypothetical protein
LIKPEWKRIGGFHLEEDGTTGVVWLAEDPVTHVVHCYDCALFTREVEAVIATGIAARGRHYPMAWRQKDKGLADTFEEAGINILPDPSPDDPAMAEIISRGIWQRMRAKQFRVDRTVGEWLEEYRTYFRDENKVPTKGFPLMAATRHAIKMLDWAEAEYSPGRSKVNYPKLAIV